MFDPSGSREMAQEARGPGLGNEDDSSPILGALPGDSEVRIMLPPRALERGE